MLAEVDVDTLRTGTASILEQFVENVGDRPVEQARHLGDKLLADGRADLSGKRHGNTPVAQQPHCRRTATPPFLPADDDRSRAIGCGQFRIQSTRSAFSAAVST